MLTLTNDRRRAEPHIVYVMLYGVPHLISQVVQIRIFAVQTLSLQFLAKLLKAGKFSEINLPTIDRLV